MPPRSAVKRETAPATAAADDNQHMQHDDEERKEHTPTITTTTEDKVDGNSALQRRLQERIQVLRSRMTVTNSDIQNAQSLSSADAFGAWGIDQSFNFDDWQRNLHIDIVELESDRVVFDLVGVEAPIANALRRIIISEVPTMAIEHVLMFQNTSIIQDEVLSHRLGLIPIAADPRKFDRVRDSKTTPMVNEKNTLVFTLEVQCTRNAGVPESASDSEKYNNHLVTSKQLKWVPQGSQSRRFAHSPIKPVYDDIVIAKLRPGQSIEAELRCEKGVGREHAKWSPVGTASYRLLPEIVITQPITGDDAVTLKNKCPMNVFDIEDHQLTVARPRDCSMCRECIRGPPGQDRIQLRRVRDHFIFSVETVGQYDKPLDIVREAIKELKSKSNTLFREIQRGVVQADADDLLPSTTGTTSDEQQIPISDVAFAAEDINDAEQLVDEDDAGGVESEPDDDDAA